MRFLIYLLFATLSSVVAAPLADFRPDVQAALKRGERRIVIPPGRYLLDRETGRGEIWSLQNAKDVEIIADGVTLVATRLTRAINFYRCEGVTVQGLTVDYDPLPFTQGTVVATAEDAGWIDVKIHAGYPLKPYSRIDVIDPKTRFRKKGMPFLWGTKGAMQSADTVRVTLPNIGKAAAIGDLATLSTGAEANSPPHAINIEWCAKMTFRNITVHSAPGMGILECEGEGGATFLNCRIVPGPKPEGATEERLLSSSWDAFQSKTIRKGPLIENCEIREAGDDSWSVQSSDFMVIRAEGAKLLLGSRDSFTDGVQKGDRLLAQLGGLEAKILERKFIDREQAGLPPELLEKLRTAAAWSKWQMGKRLIELTLEGDSPFPEGTSVFSPDRMGNGFVFRNNRIHSSGRVLLKAAGLMEGNLLVTPHAVTVCPEVPGDAAAGIEGLIIRGNTIRSAGWFCPAPWSSAAGALSITASATPPNLRPAGVFKNILIENNVFESCLGPNIVASSTAGLVIRGNTFRRAQQEPAYDTGSSFQIPKNPVMWISQCEDVRISGNKLVETGPLASPDPIVATPSVTGLKIDQ